VAERWGERPLPDVTILPKQADRIAEVANQTGAAVGVSQSGSTLTIITGPDEPHIRINAQGKNIEPQKEHLFAQETDHVHKPVHRRGGD
jgi:hypothetical protein